ncbi:hypothetical protein N9E95_00065 [Alphaproteobacteria bacterium]|nr:hypothetical protein [Alphaproteobacteria bacterium]
MINKQKIVGIVCHDAGGAEIVSSYVLLKNIKVKYCLEGPAIRVFERKLGNLKNNSLLDMINDVDWLLCGTGWQSNLEWNVIQEAKKHKKKVVSFLDHWNNYLERFSRNGIHILPDEIWVGDIYAQKIAIDTFPDTKVKLIENPYLAEIKTMLSKDKPKEKIINKLTALFLCENISEHMFLKHGDENYLGYTEHDALQLFLDNMERIDKNISVLIIRPHPSEKNPEEKYAWVKKYPMQKSCNIQFSEEVSLIQDIMDCDIVAGAETMAMVVGLTLEKRVISSIPKKGKKCVLPFYEIEHISDL